MFNEMPTDLNLQPVLRRLILHSFLERKSWKIVRVLGGAHNYKQKHERLSGYSQKKKKKKQKNHVPICPMRTRFAYLPRMLSLPNWTSNATSRSRSNYKKKQVLAIHRRVYESFCPFRSMSSLRRPWKTNADRPRRHRTMPEKIIRIKQKRSCDINKQGGVSSREIPSPRNHACGQAVRCAKLTIIFCFP